MAAERTLTFTCTLCHQQRKRAEMASAKERPTGVSSWCLECKRQKNAAWHARTRATRKERARAYYEANKASHSARMQAYRAVNRDSLNKRQRDRRLERIYGITKAVYDEMLNAQNGVCAICERPETDIDPKSGDVRRLAVDHCHVTGQVRGLLCRGCNHAIGNLGDSSTGVRRALAYLLKAEEL